MVRSSLFVVALAAATMPGCHAVSGLNDFRATDASGGGATVVTTVSSSATTSTGGQGGGGGTPPEERVVAGELLVDLDATEWLSPEDAWPNRGTIAGDFSPYDDPAPGMPDGVVAVCFDGDDAFVGPDAPLSVSGEAVRSIEVWVHNPSLQEEEAMVSWGPRGSDLQMLSFNYGDHENYGAAGHWGMDWNIGWPTSPGPPAPGRWHHLAYVFDGIQVRIYANGLPRAGRACPLNTLVTPIILGAHYANGGDIRTNNEIGAELCIARVRVHDGVLSPEDVEKNYELEAPDFQ